MAISAERPPPAKSRRSSLNNRFDRALNEHAPMYERKGKVQKRAREEEIEESSPPIPPTAPVQKRYYHSRTTSGLAARRGVGGLVSGEGAKVAKAMPNWLAEVLDIPVPPPPPSPHPLLPFGTPGPASSHHSSPSSALPSSPLGPGSRAHAQLRRPVPSYVYRQPASDPEHLIHRTPQVAPLQVAYSTPSYHPPTWHAPPPPPVVQYQHQPVYQIPQYQLPIQHPHFQAPHRPHYQVPYETPTHPSVHYNTQHQNLGSYQHHYVAAPPQTNYGSPQYEQPYMPPSTPYMPPNDPYAHTGSQYQSQPSYRPTPHSGPPHTTYAPPSAPQLPVEASPPRFERFLADRAPRHQSSPTRQENHVPTSSPSRFNIDTNFAGVPPSLSQAQCQLFSSLPLEKRRKLERKRAERLEGLQMVRNLEESVEAMSMEESMAIDPHTVAAPSRSLRGTSRVWDDGYETDELALKSGDEFEDDLEQDVTPSAQRLRPINVAPPSDRFKVNPVWSSPSLRGSPEPRSSPLGDPLFSIGSPDDSSTPLKTPRRVGDKRKHMRSKGTQTPTRALPVPSPRQAIKRRKPSSRALFDGAEFVPTHRPSSDSGFSTPSSTPSGSPSPPPPRMRQMKITEGAWRPYALPVGDPATPRKLPTPTTWAERNAMAKINGHPVVNPEEDELVSSESELEDIENWSETDFFESEDEYPVRRMRMLRRLPTVEEEDEDEVGDSPMRHETPTKAGAGSGKKVTGGEQEEVAEERIGSEDIEEFTPSQDQEFATLPLATADDTANLNTQDQPVDPTAFLPEGWAESMQAALVPSALDDEYPGKRVRFRSRSSSIEWSQGSDTDVDEVDANLTPPAPSPPRSDKKKKRIKFVPNPRAKPKKGCFKPGRAIAVAHDVGFNIWKDGY